MVSCSSDLTVKLWNPHNDTQEIIGQHRDYVKCLATPSQISTDWVVSGGLDRRIISWDLHKAEEKYSIDLGADDKRSIYALGVNGGHSGGSIIAAGGPDAIVRLWDTRTAGSSSSPITKLVGHTSNIRSILISEHGDWILSGSSDSTIKLWSVTAGRLLYTFDMHSDSVWSLYSTHPSLHVFYSADRTGLVAKTDLRGVDSDIDNEAVCSVICNEHQGVSKVIAAGQHVWTATSNSRIHRWRDFDTTPHSVYGQAFEENEKKKDEAADKDNEQTDNKNSESVVMTHFLSTQGGPSLRFQPPASLPVSSDADNVSVDTVDTYDNSLDPLSSNEPYVAPGTSIVVEPLQVNPVETLQGKVGLIKHRLLSDRERVLTTDNAGEVVLWDLLRCIPLKSYGTGQDMDLLADHLNKPASMANWCQVTTRAGQLFVTLEENTCFDAEVYADEIIPEIGEDLLKSYSAENPSVKDLSYDQRINLGKWVIKNLFSSLIDEEIKRDRDLRTSLVLKSNGVSISNGMEAPVHRLKTRDVDSLDRVQVEAPPPTAAEQPAQATTPSPPNGLTSPSKDKSSGGFMNRFRFGKNSKKSKGTEPSGNGVSTNVVVPTATVPTPAPVVAAAPIPEDDAKQPQTLEEVIADLQKPYEEKSRSTDGTALFPSSFTPPIPHDLPVIPIPVHTKLMISELGKDSGGLVDLYRGTVGCISSDLEKLEKLIPAWIARVLLLDQIPQKPEVKVGFVLVPCTEDEQAAPGIAPLPPVQQGGGRLNGYQMLRAHKAISYLVERLQVPLDDEPLGTKIVEGKRYVPELAGKSDDEIAAMDHNTWVELLCQNQVLTHTMTLATIRTRVWRSGGDVVLKYRRRKLD